MFEEGRAFEEKVEEVEVVGGVGVGALKSEKACESAGVTFVFPFAFVFVIAPGVVGSASASAPTTVLAGEGTASKGLTSCWRRPEEGSARGVSWS